MIDRYEIMRGTSPAAAPTRLLLVFDMAPTAANIAGRAESTRKKP
jgi:hypothetical protein